ncbi:hypothetical protein AVEN_174457-1, partial [Araneus ventricosus]
MAETVGHGDGEQASPKLHVQPWPSLMNRKADTLL